MPVKPISVYTQFYNSPLFTLLMRRSQKDTKLIMKMHTNIINTRDIPFIFNILKENLPTVFRSICYNEYRFPFRKEILQTEIGHLFEHILIEYLCILKINEGFDEAEYTGLTKWNWKLYSRGSFHITVSAGRGDTIRLSAALKLSIELINKLLVAANTLPLQQFPVSEAPVLPLKIS